MEGEPEEVEIVNEVLETENAYVVAQVSKRLEKGYKSLDDVRSQIERPVINQKKVEYIKERLATASNNGSETNLETIKANYGPGAEIVTESAVTFNSQMIPKIGSDKKIIGYVSGMDNLEISPAMSGMSGVYVIRVDRLNAPAEITDTDIAAKKAALQMSMQTQVENKVFGALKDVADVKDTKYNYDF